MNFGRLVFDKFEFWVTRHKKKTTQLYKHLNLILQTGRSYRE